MSLYWEERRKKEQQEKKKRGFEEIHDCPNCHGKIVCITIDNSKVTRCSYCNQVIDYRQLTDNPNFQNLLQNLPEVKGPTEKMNKTKFKYSKYYLK